MGIRVSVARSIAGLLVAAVAGAALAQPVSFPDVHGFAYSADGKRLILASHDGLVVYEGGKWSLAPAARHDYMGFSGSRDRLYSSGHPAPGSGFPNPLGIVRSSDGGRSWEKMGLEREADFHLFAVGWSSNAIYAWNHAPNSRLKQAGLYYTLNEGLLWRPAAASGLAGEPRALAVHPDDPAAVALAASRGVFLSRDSAATFRARVEGIDAYSAFFDLDGKRLWYGFFDGNARLAALALAGGAATPVALPPLGKDAVAFIAQNPAARAEYAVASFGRSVLLTRDAGRSWTPIAEAGAPKK